MGVIQGNKEEIIDIILKNQKVKGCQNSYDGTKELIGVRRKAQHNITLKHIVVAKEVCVTMSHYSFTRCL